MEITRERLEARLEKLQRDYATHQLLVSIHDGAIQECQQWLGVLEEVDEENPPAEEQEEVLG